MEVKISRKHQVVIPKAARQKLRLPKDGGYMVVTKVTPTEITFTTRHDSTNTKKGIMRFAGIAAGAWGKDPVATVRAMRDSEWD